MKWKLEKTVQDRMMLDVERYNLDYLNISNNIGIYDMNMLIFYICNILVRNIVHKLDYDIYSYYITLSSGKIIQIYYWVDYWPRYLVIFQINNLCNNNKTCLGNLHYLLDEMEIRKNN